MRKLLLLFGFFTLTPCVLIASILLLAWIHVSHVSDQFLPLQASSSLPIAYTALPSTTTQISSNVSEVDARITRLTSFFRDHHSILEQYAETIVTQADRYHLDYRLLPAIAMQESRGCVKIIQDSHNCWGWGIYTKHTTKFDSYPQAIETISKLLAKDYAQKGLDTPEEIGKLYNPGNTNDWVGKIIYFMNEVENQPIIAYLTNL